MQDMYNKLVEIFGEFEYHQIDEIIEKYSDDDINKAIVIYKNKLLTLKRTNSHGQAPGYFTKVLDNLHSKNNSSSFKQSNDDVNWRATIEWNRNSFNILKQRKDGLLNAYVKAYRNDDFPQNVLDDAETKYHQTGWYIFLGERLVHRAEKELAGKNISDFREYAENKKAILDEYDVEKEMEKAKAESILVMLHQYAHENNLIKYYYKTYNTK